MRNILLIFVVATLPVSMAAADPVASNKPVKAAPSSEPLRAKRSGSGNTCAAYGAGFVKVAGSDTCMKLGGSISVGGGIGSH